MNLPNRITVGRFVLSLVYFALLAAAQVWEAPPANRERVVLVLDIALIVFAIASVTDALDGYLARSRNVVTDFGRVADPFVDKILICGSFVFFLTLKHLSSIIGAWMVVVILAREFLVQGIRSLAESKGIAFHSSVWGKQKMIVQCIVVSCALFYSAHMHRYNWAKIVITAMIWLVLVTTVASGIAYIYSARKIFRSTPQ
ncbi:MAG: CDP-diacylglycerol--glycerol-3-phosphate 3-phosphatidyltransferase [Planctomycetota bacterium]|nr:CDP-diacylglycerol--glycerol-3-phosphate 3-phosphatidyltransferase [Planctomycetota bacterium]